MKWLDKWTKSITEQRKERKIELEKWLKETPDSFINYVLNLEDEKLMKIF
jgi:hypothetical protein